MRFGEIERSATNQILSLLRSQPEDFAYQTPKYESDVFSHNRRWLSAKPEHLPVHCGTRAVYVKQNERGSPGKQKKPFLKFPIDKKYEEKGINLLEKLSFPKRTTRTGAV